MQVYTLVNIKINDSFFFRENAKDSLRFISLKRREDTILLGGGGYMDWPPISGHPS